MVPREHSRHALGGRCLVVEEVGDASSARTPLDQFQGSAVAVYQGDDPSLWGVGDTLSARAPLDCVGDVSSARVPPDWVCNALSARAPLDRFRGNAVAVRWGDDRFQGSAVAMCWGDNPSLEGRSVMSRPCARHRIGLAMPHPCARHRITSEGVQSPCTGGTIPHCQGGW